MFDFIIFSPPPPACVPITLPVLDFGRLRATIRASVYGVGHMAGNAKHQLHGDLSTSPAQGRVGHAACPQGCDHSTALPSLCCRVTPEQAELGMAEVSGPSLGAQLQDCSSAEGLLSLQHPCGSQSCQPALVSVALGSCLCSWVYF